MSVPIQIEGPSVHILLMIGPPGAGKSLMASCLPGILPELTPAEALETSMVASVAGQLEDGKISRARPFRSPHHSASMAALTGGGLKVRPGEVSLAHLGVLFLDELPEFQRAVLDSLRQPLETGEVTVARANAHVTFGVSAFRGLNAVDGHLGKFLEHVRSGEVPQGSFLLVESLDRISRQEIATAQLGFLNLLRSGVRVVTLLDEREYSWENANAGDGMVSLIISLSILARAHEESATKARRLKEAWAAKRSRLAMVPLTSKVPAWLRLDPTSGAIVEVPERAAIVQRIFRDTLEGKGQHQIAQSLNREGVKPWGRGAYWQRSYIAKILESDAVIGTFRPHTLEYVSGKRERVPQDAVEDYFPAAVPLEVWQEARAFRHGKHSRTRGRHSAAPVTNMLAGMACCPLCGGTMTRTNKGAKSRPSYVCARAKNKAGCQYRSVRVDLVEAAIVERLPSRLRDAPAGERNLELDREVANLEAETGVLQDRIVAIVAAIETGGEAGTLVTRLRDLEGQYEAARGRLRELEGRRAATAGATVHARISRLLGALETEEGQPEPGAVNLALQSVFRRVVVNYRTGLLDFVWLHGGAVEIPFSLPEGSGLSGGFPFVDLCI